MDEFIGRTRELKKLYSLLDRRAASFAVIRGRRRIGKSRLIREFGRHLPCHIFSGLPPSPEATRQSQLDAFSRQMEIAFNMPPLNCKDWGTLFWHLGKLCANGHIIIALDEISWIGSKDPDFLGHLKNAWDLHFSCNPDLILIVCGSISSWIEKNILSHTGFVGRIHLNLKLEELPIHDAVKFWGSARERRGAHEIFSLLSVTGGVPRYLEDIRPEMSASENIHRLCFTQEGLLYQEFDQIFSDLFSAKATVYAQIAEYLIEGARTAKEISSATGKAETVVLTSLNDLVQAGFVSQDPTWNLKTMHSSRFKKYRLSDNYIRFYLKYVSCRKESIAQGAFETLSLSSLTGWDGIMGLQFENLVLNNVPILLDMLDFKLSDLVRYGPFFQKPTKRKAGCQIDLLIQARYRSVFLCEIKFSTEPIGMKVIEEVKKKLERLSLPRGWSARLVLVHVNGVTRDVMQAGVFDHIVDFSKIIPNVDEATLKEHYLEPDGEAEVEAADAEVGRDEVGSFCTR